MKDKDIKELKSRGFNLDEIYPDSGERTILSEKAPIPKKKMVVGTVTGILSLIRAIWAGISLLTLLNWSPTSGLYLKDYGGDPIVTTLLLLGILHVVLVGIGAVIIFTKKPVGGIITAIGFIFDVTGVFFVKTISMFPVLIYDIVLIICSIRFFIKARK